MGMPDDLATGRIAGASARLSVATAATPRAYVPALLLVLVVGAVYHAWLQPGVITAGDFPYYTHAQLLDGVPFPSLWDAATSTGAYNILNAPMFPLAWLQGILASFHLDWSVSERALWIIPSVLVPSAATYALSLSLFRRRVVACISAIAVVMNSYVYLLYEGGQFGVAMAYGCTPLVLWAFVRGQRRGTLAGYALTGLVLAVQAMYDIRSTYIALGVLLLYALLCGNGQVARRAGGRVLPALRASGLPHIAVALVVVAVVHAWWILPALFVRAPALPAGYQAVAGVHELSLMQLSNGLALSHPFWFANDQRIGPMNPLFFVVPLLVFALLLRRRPDRLVLFLIVTALLAAFLVKGDNSPAGGIYDWLFVHLPGFSLFRDSSKFYQPLALAYSLLLGVAASACYGLATTRAAVQRAAGAAGLALAITLAVFPAYPALLQQVRGAFAAGPVPADYTRLNSFIDRQPQFFRVLWLPARPRFGGSSAGHPALDAGEVSACCIRTVVPPSQPWSWLQSPLATEMLRMLSVRYVVVPDNVAESDIIGEPWPTGAGAPVSAMATILHTFLPELHSFTIGRLRVFVNPAPYPLIYTAPVGRGTGSIRCAVGALCLNGIAVPDYVQAHPQVADSIMAGYTAGAPPGYDVHVHLPPGSPPFYLVLQQTYDPNWTATLELDGRSGTQGATAGGPSSAQVEHVVANGYANAWVIRRPGIYHVVLTYEPQRLVLLGWLFTALALLSLGVFILMRVRRGKLARTQGDLASPGSFASPEPKRDVVSV